MQTLQRRPQDKEFRTTGTAAWPPAMCKWIAEGIVLSQQNYLAIELHDDEGVRDTVQPLGGTITPTDQPRMPPLGSDEEESEEEIERMITPPDSEADMPELESLPAEPISSPARKVFLASDPVTPAKLPKPTTSASPLGGRGFPRRTWALGKYHDYHDGSGLISPGRWDPECRTFPMGDRWEELRCRLLEPLQAEYSEVEIQKLVLKLACGPKEQILSDSCISSGRIVIEEWLSKHAAGYSSSAARQIEPGQPFCLHMLKFLLKEMGDPDFQVMEEL